jgi:hypothetical protein
MKWRKIAVSGKVSGKKAGGELEVRKIKTNG